MPKSLWPAVFGSFAGCAIIGYSQSSLYLKEEESASSFFQDDMLGCILQFASMLFSVAARLLMKRTEGILSRDEAVQTNNFCNTLFPLLYTLLVNPSGWKAFVCMTLESFCAWLTIAVLVYTIASASQMSLVRSVGPGVYSSFSAIRVVVSAWLSAIVLHEPVQDGLEWLGLMVIVITISVYTAMTLVESRRTNEKLPNISRDQAVGTGESLDIEMSRLLQPVK